MFPSDLLFPFIKIDSKKHVIMKNLDREKIAKKTTTCCFQDFYLYRCFLFFKGYLHTETKK